MASPSEGFAWKLFPGAQKICRQCGKELRVQDVGEHRKVWPKGKTEFLCKACQAENVQRMVDERLEAIKAHHRS